MKKNSNKSFKSSIYNYLFSNSTFISQFFDIFFMPKCPSRWETFGPELFGWRMFPCFCACSFALSVCVCNVGLFFPISRLSFWTIVYCPQQWFVTVTWFSSDCADHIFSTMKPGCSICREIFKENDKLRSTDCGHVFHEECIFDWNAGWAVWNKYTIV
jgi:hypothetical protein